QARLLHLDDRLLLALHGYLRRWGLGRIAAAVAFASAQGAPQASFSSSARSVVCSAWLRRARRAANAAERISRPRARTLRPAGVTSRRWRRRSALSISRRTKPAASRRFRLKVTVGFGISSATASSAG